MRADSQARRASQQYLFVLAKCRQREVISFDGPCLPLDSSMPYGA